MDDDADVARGIDIRLRAAGYEPLTASNGMQGLEMAARYSPAAIVLDVRMPDMDGLTMLAQLRLRDAGRPTPVIVLSANVVEQTRNRALDLGARCFIEKPFTAAALIEAIEQVVRHDREGA